MCWQKFPYWIKGGVIGGGILATFSFLIIIGQSLKIGLLEFFASMGWLLLVFPAAGQLCDISLFGGGSCRIGFSEMLISIGVYVLIGILIGLIVGYFKKKRY